MSFRKIDLFFCCVYLFLFSCFLLSALTVNLQPWTQNYTLSYDEGTNATIECKTDYQSFYIEWVQKKGK